MFADHLTLERIEAVQQAHCESGTGSYATPSGDISVVMDLHALLDIKITECLADGWMHDLVDRLTVLNLGVDDTVPVLEEWREVSAVDVAVLVNRGSQHGAAM